MAQFTDERRLADTHALSTDPAFKAEAGRAVHVFGGLRGAAESACDGVFGAQFRAAGRAVGGSETGGVTLALTPTLSQRELISGDL